MPKTGSIAGSWVQAGQSSRPMRFTKSRNIQKLETRYYELGDGRQLHFGN
jgi:hypothetical protein